MTFLEHILATFIGALSGFVFSIALFYLTEKWKNNRKNKELGNNLQKELQYSINFLEAYIKGFDKLLRQIPNNE